MTNVLVIDDDPGVLRLIDIMLRLEGIDVLSTPQPAAGLEILGRESPDVIVLDLGLPEMDGREFFRQARLRGYEGPVIICSAYGATAAQRELGAEAALNKPFNPEELVKMVNALSAGHDASGNGH
jgi:two-component system KDP operon response regulator KdpE